MSGLKQQVAKEVLENPVCIVTFKEDGIRVNNLKEKLNRLDIKFAEVKSASSIEIFIEQKNLED